MTPLTADYREELRIKHPDQLFGLLDVVVAAVQHRELEQYKPRLASRSELCVTQIVRGSVWPDDIIELVTPKRV